MTTQVLARSDAAPDNGVREQLQALAELPPEYAMMRLENETIQSLAMSRPRDHKRIRDEIAEQLAAYPSFASAALYCKPVGRDDRGCMQYATGLSVRAAEAIAEAYGYCRVRTDVTPIDDDHVKVSATFVDYQKGRIWEDAGIVTKLYRDRNGRMRRHADDRFYNVIVKAELSKRVREVILRSVPPGLRTELQEMAERQMRKLLGGEGVQRVLEAFGKLGVSQEQLERYLGRTVGQGWTQDDRLRLLGLYNAIEAGETTVEEAFDSVANTNGDGHPSGPQAGAGPVTADALTNGKASKGKRKAEKSETSEETETLAANAS
ncbi:MAG: hypothetical protein GXP27_07285 [Planctomycetes bacterium]|nr:hypothetical protein [Planctomycetota bacterium]